MPRGKKAEDVGDGINGGSAPERLRQFVERFERLEEDARAVAEDKKELMAEIKSEGFDTKTFRKVIAIRKRKAAEVAEEQAMLDLYLSALGMEFELEPIGTREEGDDDSGGDGLV